MAVVAVCGGGGGGPSSSSSSSSSRVCRIGFTRSAAVVFVFVCVHAVLLEAPGMCRKVVWCCCACISLLAVRFAGRLAPGRAGASVTGWCHTSQSGSKPDRELASAHPLPPAALVWLTVYPVVERTVSKKRGANSKNHEMVHDRRGKIARWTTRELREATSLASRLDGNKAMHMDHLRWVGRLCTRTLHMHAATPTVTSGSLSVIKLRMEMHRVAGAVGCASRAFSSWCHASSSPRRRSRAWWNA